MYSEFAYSPQMQIILLAATMVLTFFTTYLIAEITLLFCQVKATRKQKCMIALIAGTLLHCAWTYLIYFIGGMARFSALKMAVITSPNPFWALVYYLVAVRYFRLSPVRSIKVMSYIYYYWTMDTAIYRILGALFFQQGERYNYLLDILCQVVTFLLFFGMTVILKHLIFKYQTYLKFMEVGVFHKKRELSLYFANAAFMYISIVALTLAVPHLVAQNLILALILLLFLAINVLVDLQRYNQQVISNQTVHISALLKGTQEIRGIKHDFNNILHTYSGYLEIEAYEKLKGYHELLVETTHRASVTFDLSHRMQENPGLVSLLLGKQDAATKCNVKMKMDIKCDMEDFYIGTLDFIRVIACLLDNAIEAATQSHDRQVYFTCESKGPHSKLIIIANSTAHDVDTNDIFHYGVTSKPNRSGIGLSTVKSTLDQYPNCIFQMKYYNNQLSAYIESHNLKT